MSKSHRKEPGRPERDPSAPTRRPGEVDPDLETQGTLGNQALQAGLPAMDGASAAVAPDTAPQLAERVALTLRVAQRDAGWSEHLAELVRASALPPERREALVERLDADQALADAVSAAVTGWLGSDSEALRSELVRAFDDAARTLADAPVGPDPEGMVAAAVATALGPDRAAPEAVEGLCRQLGALLALLWDDEEERAPPGDYAAEESGA